MTANPLIKVEELTKAFGPTRALDQVSISIHRGEIVAVVGHNGSGKSTLVKVLAGFHEADSGVIDRGDESGHPTELRFIHQDLGLIDSLSTIENFSIGRPSAGGPWRVVRRAAERREARELIAQFNIDIDVDAPVSALSSAEKTILAIARALHGWNADRDIVLVLDEPTASLHGAEVDQLMEVVRRVADLGAGVLFISHRLDEVLDMADTVVALRNGKVVGHVSRADITYDGLVELVAGAPVEVARRDSGSSAETVLRVRDLHGARIHGFNVEVHAGEVVGIAGILGSGRDEVCSTVFGAMNRASGTVDLSGSALKRGDLRQAIASGVAFVPGDRHRRGAVMSMSAQENLMAVRIPGKERRFAVIRRGAEGRSASEWFATCGVVPVRPEMHLSNFSGGNQQKVVIAKWLRTKPKLLLLEEPTQGVDVGAKALVHNLVLQAANAGAAVLIASSEAKELAELCDRVIILADGTNAEELDGADVTEARILSASAPS